ncbi:glycosyltransferase family 2 protein [Halorubrum saccharovorum]|uniref:glycosyltransferase n=1 Tax=Halorubrum saccharovorum TaxID=2248 RepID=UPI0009B5C4F9|nr:glycosyltransferase family A protein [Halorubrum saccharovorum]
MTASQIQENPFVSIVIPVYADPDGLQTTLESAVNQTYSSFEIVIALTPSSGETRVIAEKYLDDYPDLVHLSEVHEKGRARARNAGIEAANGDIVAFVDADIWMESDWLETTLFDLKASDADYLACNVTIQSTCNSSFIGKYDQAISIPVKHYIEEYHFAPTAALLLTRKLLEDVGVFDPELMSGEDREFGNRVFDQGYNLCMSNCEVYHPPRKNLTEQIKKAIRIGIGIEQLRLQYPDRYSFPSLFSPLSYAPPSPTRLKSRMANNNYEPRPSEWFLFYIINHFLKIYQQYGRWKYYYSHY